MRRCQRRQSVPCGLQYTVKKTKASTLRCTEKPIHTGQYLLYDSHHPLEHKLEVIRTLNHWAEMPTKSEGKEKEQKHIRGALTTCGYQSCTFVKSTKRTRADREEETRKYNNTFILYVAGTPEILRSIFNKHTSHRQNHIAVHFKPNNPLRQKLVHPKDKTPRHKHSNVVYVVQCSQDCTDLYSRGDKTTSP